LALRFSPEVKDGLLSILGESDLSPAEMYQRSDGAYLDVSNLL
jgi:hypothetical protein